MQKLIQQFIKDNPRDVISFLYTSKGLVFEHVKYDGTVIKAIEEDEFETFEQQVMEHLKCF